MSRFGWTRSCFFRGIKKICWSNPIVRWLTKRWSDEKYIKANDWWATQTRLDLNQPKRFTEKLQWLSLNDHSQIRSDATDKYKVRQYVSGEMKKAGLPDILIPLIGVFDTVEELEWEELPNSFVLKANHGSGWNVLVKDKADANKEEVFTKLRTWMMDNYYHYGREHQYKGIAPKIICEEFLKNDDGSEILDYKFMCFNGKPEMLWIDYNRHTNHVRNFYDLDGNPLDYISDVPADYSIQFQKPQNYEQMLEIAQTLAKPFKHVRVDLYNVNGKVYFGELTFSSWGGFVVYRTPKLDDIWGEMFDVK